MKTTIVRLKQLIQEELKLALVEKKTHSSWRQAIRADAGLGSFDDIKTLGDIGAHGDALDRSEREQVDAGADPKAIQMPHLKRREYAKAAKRKREREARRKEREELRKADAAEAPMTSGETPMSIDRSMIDAPALQEDEGLMLDPGIHDAIERRMRELEWEEEQERKAKKLSDISSDNKAALDYARAHSRLDENKMKFTKSQLQKIIKEELKNVLSEYSLFSEEEPALRLAKAHDTHLDPSIDTDRDVIDRERSFGPDDPDLIEIAKELAWRQGEIDRTSYDWRKFMPEAEKEYFRRYGDEMLEEGYDYFRDQSLGGVGGGTDWESARDKGWEDGSSGREPDPKYAGRSSYMDSYRLGREQWDSEVAGDPDGDSDDAAELRDIANDIEEKGIMMPPVTSKSHRRMRQVARRGPEGLTKLPYAMSEDNSMKITKSHLELIIKEELESVLNESNFFDNMRAKRKRGEKPAKPGDKDYPSEKEWKKITAEELTEAERLDKNKMPCNKPRRTPNHPTKSHVVKACEGGKEKIIRFGEQGASTAGAPKKGESEKMKKKRKSFKARHGKNIKKGKMSAAYWADKVKW